MSIPISPLIPMLYYRGDLYKEAGLAAPEDLRRARGQRAQVPQPARRCTASSSAARAARTPSPMTSIPTSTVIGGGIFKDQSRATTRSPSTAAKVATALDYYIRLAREAGHPQDRVARPGRGHPGTWSPGNDAHIMMVIAAWSQMDDPNKSVVVDKVELAPPPSLPGMPTAPGLGHWLGGISHNVPDDRKRAAVEFLRWFQTKDAQLVTAKARRHPDQCRGLPASRSPTSAISLDEAAGGGAAALRSTSTSSPKRAR